jgi:hypothetical protein
MSIDSVKKHLTIERNLIVGESIISQHIRSSNISSQSMQSRDLFLSGNLVVASDLSSSTIPSGGISSNGDFFLTATTTQQDWQTPLSLSTYVITGNAVGQLCQVYVEMCSTTDVESEQIVFSHLPASFFPNTKLSFPVSILSCERELKQGLFVVDPLQRTIKFYGDWKANELLTATLMYIRV